MELLKRLGAPAFVEGVREHAQLAVVGGLVYVLVETVWRGHSHWTMAVLGGVCFVAIGVLNEWWPKMPMLIQMLLGALIVTAAELVTGLIVNVWLGWNVWDYSAMPFNFLGQISLPFSGLWFALSGAAVVLEDWLHKFLDAQPE